MEQIEKRLEEITRQEWIAFRWVEAPQSYGDEERMFISQGRRTPDEAMEAMENWDMTAEERGMTKEPEDASAMEPARDIRCAACGSDRFREVIKEEKGLLQ